LGGDAFLHKQMKNFFIVFSLCFAVFFFGLFLQTQQAHASSADPYTEFCTETSLENNVDPSCTARCYEGCGCSGVGCNAECVRECVFGACYGPHPVSGPCYNVPLLYPNMTPQAPFSDGTNFCVSFFDDGTPVYDPSTGYITKPKSSISNASCEASAWNCTDVNDNPISPPCSSGGLWGGQVESWSNNNTMVASCMNTGDSFPACVDMGTCGNYRSSVMMVANAVRVCCDGPVVNSDGTCPTGGGTGGNPQPSLGATWNDTNSETMTYTLTPQDVQSGHITIPFSYFNDGATGSVLHVTGCTPNDNNTGVIKDYSCPSANLQAN
jgi:hypothetical protein